MAVLRVLGIGSPSPVIKGQKIFLRPPVVRDHAEWAMLRAESKAFLQPWEPQWPSDDLSRHSFRRRIKDYARQARDDRGFAFFLFRNCDGRLVGGLTLSNVRRGVAQTGSLGYWMGQRYAGQGLMREAVETLLPFVFGKLGLHRLEAASQPNNERSLRLLAATGFRKEGYAKGYLRIDGRWQDHVLFAIAKDDLNRMTARKPALKLELAG